MRRRGLIAFAKTLLKQSERNAPLTVTSGAGRKAIAMPNKSKFELSVKYSDANFGTRVLKLTGRDAWTLDQLVRCGERGCTPIDNPAPRWSAYVHDLRKEGLRIETITEPHGGTFAGTHARYVLRTTVTVEMVTMPMPQGPKSDG